MTAWVDVECPSCHYPFEIQLIDARTQVYRLCPCCRSLIHLIEPDGSVSTVSRDVAGLMREVEDTVAELQRTLGRFGI